MIYLKSKYISLNRTLFLLRLKRIKKGWLKDNEEKARRAIIWDFIFLEISKEEKPSPIIKNHALKWIKKSSIEDR